MANAARIILKQWLESMRKLNGEKHYVARVQRGDLRASGPEQLLL
jgi:hypothetical protein